MRVFPICGNSSSCCARKSSSVWGVFLLSASSSRILPSPGSMASGLTGTAYFSWAPFIPRHFCATQITSPLLSMILPPCGLKHGNLASCPPRNDLPHLLSLIHISEKSDGQLQAIGENAKDTFIILLIDQKTRRPVQCFIEVSSLFMTTNCLMGVT